MNATRSDVRKVCACYLKRKLPGPSKNAKCKQLQVRKKIVSLACRMMNASLVTVRGMYAPPAKTPIGRDATLMFSKRFGRKCPYGSAVRK